MLSWTDILKFTDNGNPTPDRRIEKTDEEWRELLTPKQFEIARRKGTERAGTGAFCQTYKPGLYSCICCSALLFDARTKFESGTGWPSFTRPVKENAVSYAKDNGYGMVRVEVMCNTCDAHLGHVFPDGPKPSGLRYCINATSLQLMDEDTTEAIAILGGGCFWCTEAIFQSIKGVKNVEPGYSGGTVKNPTYQEVCSGKTGHAEVIKIIYNPMELAYTDLLKIFFSTHDPTTLNRQGHDTGTQYRSVIFYQNEKEQKTAAEVIREMAGYFNDPIVTALNPLENWYPAEEYHQNYYNNNSTQPYCKAVISPKLQKLRESVIK